MLTEVTHEENEVLTEEKWLQWEMELTGGFYDTSVLKNTYAKLEQSEDLKREFLSYPTSLQLNILHNLGESRSNAEDIHTESALRLRMSDSLPLYRNNGKDPVNWITEDSAVIMECIDLYKEWSEVEATQFFSKLEDFRRFYMKHPQYKEGSDHIVPLLLAMLHTVSLVTEILEVWTKSELKTSKLSGLVNLCENWENVKEYPLEWAVNL